jgi:hypothetical protein
MKEEIRKRIMEAVSAVPEGYLSDAVIKETIRCVLFSYLQEQGLVPVPAFRNPRFPEGPVDIIGVKAGPEIESAFCSNPTVELEDVKRLDRVPSEKKFVISFSKNPEKIKLSRLYLKPGMEHIDLHGTEA